MYALYRIYLVITCTLEEIASEIKQLGLSKGTFYQGFHYLMLANGCLSQNKDNKKHTKVSINHSRIDGT